MATIPARNLPDTPEGMTKLFCNTGAGTVVGAIYGSIVSAWSTPHARSDGVAMADEALPSFTKMWRHVGGNAFIFASFAAAFTIGESTMAAARGESDIWAAVAGGFAGGAVLGMRASKLANAVGVAAGFGFASGVVHLTGGAVIQDKEKIRARFETIRP